MRMYSMRSWSAAGTLLVAFAVAGCDRAQPSTEREPPSEQPAVDAAPAEQTIATASEQAPVRPAAAAAAQSATASAAAASTIPATVAPAPPRAEHQIIADVYERAGPAVVTISPGRGLGSGFLIDGQGHIVTNNHVVEGAPDGQVLVSFSGLFDTLGSVVGTDRDSDVAVVKVEEVPEGVQPVELGDSDAVRIGQPTIAIGNPFGQERTVTTGIISALGRVITEDPGAYAIGGAIQTDASINPGNSGGPLLDTDARVIGMNTAILSQSGTSSGIGFAVPVNLIKKIAPSLIETGSYQHPWLGVQMREVSTVIAKQESLPSPGIQLRASQPDSPAARAGVPDGAILTAIDGMQVTSTEDVIAYLELNTSPGDTLALSIVEPGGQSRDVQLTVGARPRVEDQGQEEPPLPQQPAP